MTTMKCFSQTIVDMSHSSVRMIPILLAAELRVDLVCSVTLQDIHVFNMR